MMNKRNKKYQLQKLNSQHQEYRNKQLSFNNRLTILDRTKPYDALQDPHASYYFVSRSVRSHLKTIKAAAISETTNSLEKERLKKLLNDKIKPKNKHFFKDLAFLNLNQLITSQAFRKTSIRTVHSQRKKNPENNVQRRNEQERVTNLENKKWNERRQKLKKRQFGHLSQQFNKSSINRAGYEQPQLQDFYQKKDEQKISRQKSQKRQGNSKDNKAKTKKSMVGKKKNMTIDPLLGQREKKIKEEIHEKKHRSFMNFIQEKKRLILMAKQKSLDQSNNLQKDNHGSMNQ